MSYALSAFLLTEDELRRFPGNTDSGLMRRCLSVVEGQLADLDEQLIDEDEEDAISHRQAFLELFSGSFSAPHCGSTYGWAFESLCACLGTSLSNRGFSPCQMGWYDELDAFLEQTATSLRFADLVERCPIAIPLSDDWPMIGHWPHRQIVAAAKPITELLPAADTPEIAEALTTVSGWLEMATSKPGSVIVGFHG